MFQGIKPNRPDSFESRPDLVMRILSNKTLLVAATLLLSLIAVVALAVFIQFDDWALNLFRVLVITVHSSLLYNELPAFFAFLGACFFSIQMLYRRSVTNDLRASAFISASTRITLGVIGAWLLQVLFSANAIGPAL